MLPSPLMTATAAPSIGLTSAEAARRLAELGLNDPAPQRQRSHLVELLLQFANPLVCILLFASIMSAFVGELINAAIISVIVSRRGVLGWGSMAGKARKLRA